MLSSQKDFFSVKSLEQSDKYLCLPCKKVAVKVLFVKCNLSEYNKRSFLSSLLTDLKQQLYLFGCQLSLYVSTTINRSVLSFGINQLTRWQIAGN